VQRRQEQQAALQRQESEERKREFEERKRQKELENLEARQKLHDKEGFYYGGKFAMGSGKLEQIIGGTHIKSPCSLFGGIGTVGYRVSPWVRFEFEGGGYSSSTGAGYGGLRLLTCTGQFYVDIPMGGDSLWRPYVNAGIGVEELVWSGGNSNSYGCYNWGFGIAYAMTKHTILDISYRYRDALEDIEMGGRGLRSYNLRLRDSHELITGIRYVF